MGVARLLSALTLTLSGLWAAEPADLPRLDWTERSDWVNVKTGVTPAAIGDGQADDTPAIQAALDSGGDGLSVYLPAGTYRLTRTLVLEGPRVGVLLVGHGRDTRLVWDGEVGGRIFRSNGAAYGRYIGLTWDGRGRAAVGFDHNSEKRFETEVRHEHEAFLNFTGYGIRIGWEQKLASAEINYFNCLFEHCGVGVAMLTFNDYDNTFDGCEFRDCGVGIQDHKGNFYARNTHFEASRETDFEIGSEHGDSIRRCTSHGSRRFVTEIGTIAPLVIEDCHVAGWTDPDGAVQLNGSPVLLFDCVFSEPPGPNPPVKTAGGQPLMIAANQPEDPAALVAASPAPKLYVLPPGTRKGVVRDATQAFLRSTATVPSRIFDAKADFGATGDGQADDTPAVQSAIDAARQHGQGALAYLPAGRYVLTRSLNVTGADYAFGGAGFQTRLVWRGPENGIAIEVADPQNLTLEQFMVGHHDTGPQPLAADIHQTSGGGPSSITYDGVFAYGMYQKQPDRQGILFDNLSAQSLVHGVHVQGNLRFRDCARARFLFRTSFEGTVSVAGKAKERDGLLGFMTRLCTIAAPTVHVRDNQSLVMSDFYAEQCLQHLLLEGAADDPPGNVTIQGAKMHMTTEEPLFEARGYHGRVYLGSDQFYIEPKEPRIIAAGDGPLDLTLAGHFLYQVAPQFELAPSTRLVLLANCGLDDAGLERPDALAPFAAALDDLRRVGELDHELR